MTTRKRSNAGYVIRGSILELLSDEESAPMSIPETAIQLADGDEYLDLAQLERGVRRAVARPTPMGRVLPRRPAGGRTWRRIFSHLAAHRAGR